MEYTARIEGGDGGTITFRARDAAQARKIAEEWVREGDYGDEPRAVDVGYSLDGPDVGPHERVAHITVATS